MKLLWLCVFFTLIFAKQYQWIQLVWNLQINPRSHIDVTFLPEAKNISWNVTCNKRTTIMLLLNDEYNTLKFGKSFKYIFKDENTTNSVGFFDNELQIGRGVSLGILNEYQDKLDVQAYLDEYIPVGLNALTITTVVLVCICGSAFIIVCVLCTFSGNSLSYSKKKLVNRH